MATVSVIVPTLNRRETLTRLVQTLNDQPRDAVAPAARAFMAEIRAALDTP